MIHFPATHPGDIYLYIQGCQVLPWRFQNPGGGFEEEPRRVHVMAHQFPISLEEIQIAKMPDLVTQVKAGLGLLSPLGDVFVVWFFGVEGLSEGVRPYSVGAASSLIPLVY